MALNLRFSRCLYVCVRMYMVNANSCGVYILHVCQRWALLLSGQRNNYLGDVHAMWFPPLLLPRLGVLITRTCRCWNSSYPRLPRDPRKRLLVTSMNRVDRLKNELRFTVPYVSGDF